MLASNMLIYSIILAGTTLISKGEPYFTNSDNITEDRFLEEYLKLDAHEIATLSHRANHMIKYCSIRGPGYKRKCDELKQGHNKLFTPHQGVCYAFNMVAYNLLNSSFQIDNLGPNNGLMLKMDVEGMNLLFRDVVLFKNL